jgi:uncharacterized alpha-E superfamily protein
MATLLPAGDGVAIRRALGNLPSRAADNFFWLGRYLERAEATLRVVRCLCARAMDPDFATGSGRQSVLRLVRLLAAGSAVAPDATDGSAAEVASAALQDTSRPGSAAATAAAARRAAGTVRERLSPDSWRLLAALGERLAREDLRSLSEAEAFDQADAALRLVAALSGLFQENTHRVAGWRFLDLGRRVERGINTCRFARSLADRDATAEALDLLLDLIDSQITYRSRYLVGAALAPVRDMAFLDPFNPRSVAFQAARIDEHLAALPTLRDDGILEVPRRIALGIAADLAVDEAAHVDAQKVLTVEQRLVSLAEAIARRYFLQGPQAPRPDREAELA